MPESVEYYYLGLDVHKNSSTATMLDKSGHLLGSEKLINTKKAFEEFINAYPNGRIKAVLEAGRNWGIIYDLLESLPSVEKVALANPPKVKAIADAKLKTDTIDSLTLAQLLRTDYIPEVFVPPKAVRYKKYLVRHRCFLVALKTRVKNRIHIILERNHLLLPDFTDLFGKRGRAFLETVELPIAETFLLHSHLQLLDYLENEIKATQGIIQDELEDWESVKYLKSIPGIGAVFAPLIALEICDINRFSSPKKLWSYAGLVPTTYASGSKVYHGGLIKHANKWLRWAFIEAAHSAIKSSFYFGSCYNNKQSTKGSQAAIIATARKLACVVYYVLKEKRVYCEYFRSRLSSKKASL